MKKIIRTAAALLVAAPLVASAADEGPAVKLSGLVSTYYSAALGEPQSFENPALYLSNQPTGFNLEFAKLTATVEGKSAGLRLDLAYAPQGFLVSTGGSGDPTRLNVQQAYATFKLGQFTLEAGRFVTPAGFEVFETNANWLFTKGLLFTFAVPTAHEGVRVSAAVPQVDGLTATAYLANGSDLFTNDTGFTESPYKTGILSLVYSKGDTTAALNYFLSKVPGSGDSVWLLDAVATQSLGALTVNVSGDFGSYNFDAPGLETADFWGLGASAKLALSEKLNVAARLEYFNDEQGHHTALATENLTSFTVGAGLPFGNAELRAELRGDLADEEIFGENDPTDTAVTFTVGALAWF